MISKTRFRFLRRLSTLVVVTLAGCQTETPLEQTPASRHLQILNLSQLPPAIREQSLSVGSTLQKQSLFSKNERSFGTVANGRIHRVERPDGRVSYTLPLQKLGTGLYYDNLVIQQLPDGTTTETLIRYEPQREWWQQSQGVYDYATYSGRVSFFTASGEPIASIALQEGRIAPSPADKTGTAQRVELSCYITDVQYAGLEQDGVFYVTDIMYWVECEISSDGNIGPDGGSYDAGGGGSGVGSAPTGEPEYAEDGGGTGGNGDTPGGEAEEVVIEGPNHPIADINEYLECFDPAQGATVTIYVNQPIANSDSVFTTGSDKAGHSFISISQNGNTSVFGFYPTGTADPFINYSQSGVMGNDSNGSYDVSISANVNATTLQSILNHSLNYSSTYNLYTQNCTDFAIEIGNIMGIGLPDCYSTFGAGGGSNPAALGQYIRNNFSTNATYTVNESGGTASTNHKGC